MLTWTELDIFWKVLIWFCGGIGSLAVTGKVVFGWFAPWRAMQKTMKSYGVRLDNDHKRLNREEKFTQAMLSSQMALLDHAITGNSIDKLKAARDNLQTCLIEGGTQ